MFYCCNKCGKKRCGHHAIFYKPCYSARRKRGLLADCEDCDKRFVCVTDGDLLEYEYQLSLVRNGNVVE